MSHGQGFQDARVMVSWNYARVDVASTESQMRAQNRSTLIAGSPSHVGAVALFAPWVNRHLLTVECEDRDPVQAFEAPSQIIRQLAETPDGIRFLCIATELSKGRGGFGSPRPRYAIALGCEVSYAKDFVYADGLDLTSKGTFDPIGISCRICERTNCPQRAIPPLKSRLRIDRDRRDILPYQLPG